MISDIGHLFMSVDPLHVFFGEMSTQVLFFIGFLWFVVKLSAFCINLGYAPYWVYHWQVSPPVQ